MARALAVLSAAAAAGAFVLPDAFLGVWRGVPASTILGPFVNNYTFSIAPADGFGWVFSDNIDWNEDGEGAGGWQRFYVTNGTGKLWYCGTLNEMADHPLVTGFPARRQPFDLVSANATSLEFCLDMNTEMTAVAVPAYAPWPLNVAPFEEPCSGCGCSRWTLTLGEDGTLHSTHVTGGASVHLDVTMKKVAPAPAHTFAPMPVKGDSFECDYTPGGRDAVPVAYNTGCPYRRHPKAAALPALRGPSGYEHCYVLNEHTGYTVAWTLDEAAGVLRLAVSVPAADENTYVAIGFRPYGLAPTGPDQGMLPSVLMTGMNRQFGMEGADIVLGAAALGVEQRFAKDFVGLPPVDASLAITDAAATYAGGRVTLSFTRPLNGGYMKAHFNVDSTILSPAADFIWAAGRAEGGAPVYHERTRGLRMLNWTHPENTLHPSFKCAA